MKSKANFLNWLIICAMSIGFASCSKTDVDKQVYPLRYKIIKQQAADSTISESLYNELKTMFAANNINISDFQIKEGSSQNNVYCNQFVNGYLIENEDSISDNIIFRFNDKGVVIDTLGEIITDPSLLERIKNTPHESEASISYYLVNELSNVVKYEKEPTRSLLLADRFLAEECYFKYSEGGQSIYRKALKINFEKTNYYTTYIALEWQTMLP